MPNSNISNASMTNSGDGTLSGTPADNSATGDNRVITAGSSQDSSGAMNSNSSNIGMSNSSTMTSDSSNSRAMNSGSMNRERTGRRDRN